MFVTGENRRAEILRDLVDWDMQTQAYLLILLDRQRIIPSLVLRAAWQYRTIALRDTRYHHNYHI